MTTAAMVRPPFIGMSPGSFALHTLTHRLPKIVDDVRALPGWDAEVQCRLADLRASLPAGQLPTPLLPNAVDGEFWNGWLEGRTGASWLDLSFFEAEVLFYHLVLAAVGYVDERSRDPFAEKKRASLLGDGDDVVRFADWLEREAGAPGRIIDAMGIALWANRADLSQLSVSSGRGELLIDDRLRVQAILQAAPPSFIVDYVLDNAGSELLGDLVLIDAILAASSGARVRVHGKPFPFFVSDATLRDCREAMAHLERHADVAASAWGRRVSAAVADRRLELVTDPFWCRPLHLTQLPEGLVAVLGSSRLLLLKGDLNMRRYLEDRSWPHDQPAATLRLRDLPPASTLRVLKSEIMVGLPPGRADALAVREPDWLTSGACAAIQLFD